jgi:2-dehydro-3-deoxy-D-arabinonate dehydratase
MKLYKLSDAIIIDDGTQTHLYRGDWDALINRDDISSFLSHLVSSVTLDEPPLDWIDQIVAPLVSQEVWAAGVTYYRSRTARMAESQDTGGDSFYDQVYNAERPELFFKATPHRVAAPNSAVRIRKDSRWNVPEPELALAITNTGRIIGYTIGNDMSSRDIEGENPLYLPQAKVYDRSCAIGPCVLVSDEMPENSTKICLDIQRCGETVFAGLTTLAQLKRTPRTLVEFLYRDNSFPQGCILLTGTGIVPPDDFTLASGDQIRITVEPIGTLVNVVE